jgi:hypothetical protein
VRAAAAVAGRPQERADEPVQPEIVGCAEGIAQGSKCEAGAAECAPEALEVVDRDRAGPGAAVVVAVDAAGAGAAARLIQWLALHPLAAALAPGGVATSATFAIGSFRWHRGR